MSRKPGNISRFFTNLKNSFFVAKQTSKYIGSDHFGNEYYEVIGDSSRNIRGQRYIKEKAGLSTHDIPDVPVEWSAWLRGRRKNPPTEEEIKRNYGKMMQKKLRAEQLEKKFSQVSEENESDKSLITETIISNDPKTPFPKYEDLEDTPGQKYNKEGTEIK
ncbi:mimitin, mitochondrial [Plakobranchus ocellatus]|uniref:Mimitin, mitochondrial n=1 Tax=Plakobranchus ocellatus TaxID=259542 RepID=A0AAV3ZV08_9GAST|nr:mimitin, mitochondrial [Plakobranchus ocellatus]